MGKRRRVITISITTLALAAIAIVVGLTYLQRSRPFDGQRAYEDVAYQVGLGPRTPGSEAHKAVVEWISQSLHKAKWQVEVQEALVGDVTIKNIIGRRGNDTPWIILGSHYDSRLLADQDRSPDMRKQPVLGADDGASSTAVLLELARDLPLISDKTVWLVFFDAEDNGNIPGYEWSMGAQYFVSQLEGKPDHVVILDMVGDKDLNIYMEQNSDPGLNQEIWNVAAGLGFSQFIPRYKYDLIDDHIPFIQAGISAGDIIDFSYPYWHTSQDTLDKISLDSLQAVGDTMLKWLSLYPK